MQHKNIYMTSDQLVSRMYGMIDSIFRIQQIQLLGRDLKGKEHDTLWNQIEAEIHLHRHKTVIRACRGRQDPLKEVKVREKPEIKEDDDLATTARKKRGIDDPRTVKLHRDKTEGLGISITVGCFIKVACVIDIKLFFYGLISL